MSASQLPTSRRSHTTARRAGSALGQRPVVLDRYRLHVRLGAGAFGAVWLARDQRLDRDVAVKVLPRERILGRRFEREARAAARLSHPGIVTLYEAAVDDDDAYLVSELVRGGTLEELLQAGRLSDRDIVAIGISLCDALMHAHEQGVVHRDVKPSNVLIPERPASRSQIARLTDFGVARVIGGDSLTRTGDVIGTAAYMSPEQAEGREANAAADLYSLSLVIYEALTGVNPIRTGAAGQRARRLGAHLPPLRRQRRELPRELAHGIDLALRPRPRERGSVAELRDELSRALDQVHDFPGVVESRWQVRRHGSSKGVEPEGGGSETPGFTDIGHESRDRASGAEAGWEWAMRGAAGASAAVLTAWLAAHLLAPSPIAPPAAALITGLMVAALPRLGWAALAGALAVALVLQGKPGAALLILIAALVPVALLPRRPTEWPWGVAAPALGTLLLAGAWPAFAARAHTVWRRMGLAVTGWVWLLAATAIGNADLYTRRPRGMPTASTWMPSVYATSHNVLVPLLGRGILAGALVWAAAAALLPGIRNQRHLWLDVVVVTVWAATVASLVATVSGGHHGYGLRPHAAAVGAVASAAVALAPALGKRALPWRTRTSQVARLA